MTETGELVGFDVETAIEEAREIAGDDLLACAEYTTTEYRTLFADESLVETYGGEASLTAVLDEVFTYCYMDFSDRQLFEEEFPAAGTVEYFLARLDGVVVVRFLRTWEGLLVLLSPEAPVAETVETLQQIIAETGETETSPYAPE